MRRADSAATSRRFRESVRLLHLWSVPAGSPALAQVVQNCRCWPEMARLRGFPGGGQRFVQSAALLLGEVIAFVVRDQLEDGSLGQARRLV